MKKLLVIGFVIMLLFQFADAQPNVQTSPKPQAWLKIFDGTIGAGGDGVDTTDAFPINKIGGVFTVFIKTDTTGASVELANQSDSCLTVALQLKHARTGNNAADSSLGWGSYYNDNDSYKSVSNISKLDTLDRAIVNVATGLKYMKLGEFDPWNWADSARLILYIGHGDSLKARLEAGGQ